MYEYENNYLSIGVRLLVSRINGKLLNDFHKTACMEIGNAAHGPRIRLQYIQYNIRLIKADRTQPVHNVKR